MPNAGTVVISARGEQRVRGGHPWVYRADVVDVDAAGGEIVRVIGPRQRTIGSALFSDQSQIAIRMLTHGDQPADLALLRRLLEGALAFRESLALDATAYRLVHAEGDLLPSLVVDRYGDCLVVQALSQGMDRLLPAVTEMLVALLSPAGILARNDPKVRVLEGLPQTVDVLYGDIPEAVEVREGTIEYAGARRPACSSISGRTATRRRGMRAGGSSTASATTAGSPSGWRGTARRWRRSTSRPMRSRGFGTMRRATACRI